MQSCDGRTLSPITHKVRPKNLLCVLISLVVALAYVLAGCGETPVLSAKETKRLLGQLPYRYKFRQVAKPEGADATVAGRAVGRHRTILNFGIALGHGHMGVPVPRAGTEESYGYPRGGFIFTDDILITEPDGDLESNPHFHTAAQLNEATSMAVAMTDKLCLAATGEHCPP